MVNDEKLYKNFLILLLKEDLDKPIIEILKLLKLNHSTFYNHFFSFDNFIEESLNLFSSKLINKRKSMSNDNIFKVIKNLNILILNEIYKHREILNFEIFINNLNVYSNFFKNSYFHLILHNITLPSIYYKKEKIDLNILLEEAYFSLIIHLKNKNSNFFEYSLIS